ncbi:glycosyltransferase family 25 protein [Aplosporella prunicola CBS 121167]|uniref:Glycosyltransferase family 25 protein n=1 Tax=Aplosporella prunicola CBS 121167 TaxID=1176127 RepID=A0A6A6BK61_9PEZI|nr:glycosyltransferase family 25 protein [Aplosporella prunicola CBS 121167]KAF2142941.1 glycosyltransferase family 25 protein [Aplosporella prunicola CBS 121167]
MFLIKPLGLFQKIFVIKLSSRTDHRDSMSLSAAFTDLNIEYVNSIAEDEEKILSPDGSKTNLNEADLEVWRAHKNVARMIVEQNITSALVLEEGVDWDLHIKAQMQDFANASRLLVQPLLNKPDQHLDPTYPQPSTSQYAQDFMVGEYFTTNPSTSPYGDVDRWDLFWLGHCGCRFPRPSDRNAPLGRAIIAHDETVPEPEHVDIQFGSEELVRKYPAHTRVVSRARMNSCALGYGISLPGARRLLYEFDVHEVNTADMVLRSMCDGGDGRPSRACLTVQPELFQLHRPVGSRSRWGDVLGHGSGYSEQTVTRNIRWSTRANLRKLVDGETDYIEQFKDKEQTSKLGYE